MILSAITYSSPFDKFSIAGTRASGGFSQSQKTKEAAVESRAAVLR
jgi:hypothetical protein